MLPNIVGERRLTRTSRLLWITIALACLLTPPPLLGAQNASEPAIQVDSETISQEAFKKQIQHHLNKMKSQKNSNHGASGPSDEELTRIAKEQIKNRIVRFFVLKVHAQKADIRISEKEIDEQWKRLVKRYGSERKLNEALSKADETSESLRREIRVNLRIRKFIQRETRDPSVSNREARSFYEKNSQQFKDRSFPEVKPRIVQFLKKRKRQRAVQRLVRKLKKKTDIKVNV